MPTNVLSETSTQPWVSTAPYPLVAVLPSNVQPARVIPPSDDPPATAAPLTATLSRNTTPRS
ncbi:MAG TPA: hypothetical protein PKC26_12555, partial [Plasticicumulans sp.]|nr:hypothetical protein [Plasticicumulans sp.]